MVWCGMVWCGMVWRLEGINTTHGQHIICNKYEATKCDVTSHQISVKSEKL